jgi:multiphosphoryl transfer protein
VVGLVLVSHSHDLVSGLRDLIAQMEPDVPIGIAGGTPEGTLGTSLELVDAALEAADTGDGAVILFDLGSAEMTAEAALEFLDDDQREQFVMVDAPLVEGALAAASAAAGDATLAEVAGAARGTAATSAPPATQPQADHTVTLRLRNAQGLHARPASAIVRALRPLDATVHVTRSDTEQHANAASLLDLVSLSATAGTHIEVSATGADAERALAAIQRLVEDGFGEPLADQGTAPDAPPKEQVEGPISGAPGLAIGPAAWLRQPDPEFPPDDDDPAHRRVRLDAARRHARRELEQSAGASAGIFAAQADVLDDPQLADAVNARLDEGEPAAQAWWTAIEQQRERLAQLTGELFAARAADIDDVGRRVLRWLGVDAGAVEIREGQIIVADDLTPVQMQAVHQGGGVGVVLRGGTPTAHAAIVARNLGLPLVLRAGARIDGIAEGDVLLVDGDHGTVEIDPPEDRQQAVRDQLAQQARQQHARRAAAQAPVFRADGRQIEVAANVASVHEAELAVSYGADAVGLLRTEFLFADRTTLPSEDEQVAALDSILGALQGRSAIIRTLDIGGDKPNAALDLDPVRNGFLGVRGIRMSLQDPELFGVQLRAILRVAATHSVRIMLPFVTAVDEVVAAREHLARARAELDERGVATGNPEFGMMIEVPVTALRPEPFLEQVDFVSVGTNDLFQYLAAAGRTVAEVSDLAGTARPALDGLIATICRAADRAGRWVGVCGEIAAEPDTAARLVELGVTELSMAPAAIPSVKERLRKVMSS